MKFGTKTIHAGISPDPSTGAIMTPIFQTSTYVQSAPGVHQGYEYGRTQNPTRDALQNNLAALENAKYGVCFASGLAATDTLIRTLSPGDEIVCGSDLYGGTYRLFTKGFEKYGLKFHFIDMTDASVVADYVNDNTKMIWVETPSNPMLNIIDIAAVAKIANAKGITFVVDNTFASPYIQNPIDQGADVVVHSVTKYLGGHSDTIMGAICLNDEELHTQLKFLQNAVGAVPAPMDCFLALRGIKTLHIRLQRHCENAERIARFLADHPMVSKVNWPGFESHPNHEIAKRQMRAYGGMVSFSLKVDTLEAGVKVMSATKLFSLAESLGGVESLIGHPATMTHASIPLEERIKTGVVDSLIRLSVGIEDGDDLIADLEQALAVLS